MWQEDTLRNQKSEMNQLQGRMNTNKWEKLTNEKRQSLRKWKSKKKKHLQKKFKKLINHHHDWQSVKCTKGSKFQKTVDRARYKQSKIKKLIETAKTKILNFSDFELTDDHYLILSRGFNFIPTPTPSQLKHGEWTNAMKHIRTNEWLDVFSEAERKEFEKLHNLKVQKTNRPKETYFTLTEKAKAHSETVLAGMRNFNNWAQIKKQNLHRDQLRSLRQLRDVCNKSIMICQSDKDQKLVLLNMDDYKRRVQSEIDNNYTPTTIPTPAQTSLVKEECRNLCKKLHEYDKISDLCLQGVVGLKFKESTNTYTPTRYFADQFHFDFDADFAHVYPLFKTHKLKPGEVYSKIDQIPIRLVTAANRIPTSKIMNMLEMVLSEPMQKYCGSEYTKDSPDYLKCLTTEKVYSEECLSILD